MPVFKVAEERDGGELTDLLIEAGKEAGFSYTDCNGTILLSKEILEYASLTPKILASKCHTLYLYFNNLSKGKKYKEMECSAEIGYPLKFTERINLRYYPKYSAPYFDLIKKLKPKLGVREVSPNPGLVE